MVEKLEINAVRYVFEFIHYNNNPLPPDDASATDADHRHHCQHNDYDHDHCCKDDANDLHGQQFVG